MNLKSIPECIRDPAVRAVAVCSSAYQSAKDLYGIGEEKLIVVCNNNLPEHLHPIAEKIVRALPETLFCLSMFTGVGKLVAMSFFAFRSIQIISPFVITAVKEGIEREQMSKAAQEFTANLDHTIHNFAPAILVSSTVCGVVAAVFGIARCSLPKVVPMAMHAAFYGILAHLAYNQSMHHHPVGFAPAAAAEAM